MSQHKIKLTKLAKKQSALVKSFIKTFMRAESVRGLEEQFMAFSNFNGQFPPNQDPEESVRSRGIKSCVHMCSSYLEIDDGREAQHVLQQH